ncbi:acyl-CoA synthetase [Saccharopolyspora sp. HNM0983]|uniref:Acyl-CoA synthetase n=1 Tax=Saccharopolyspora montiporae TaxID=2781240 RepID=A0A929BA41_9PSEU|nr:acyl-CoA synthetase [Saccharopolyspora sp. HNM0983]MBE9373812.1 acyl-CoA synthetase [Saccharopolyspora sp. HNM0983]
MSAPNTTFDLSTVFDTVARAVPEREVFVWGGLRLRYREMNARIDGLARHLVQRGLACHGNRGDLAGHVSHQSHLGLYLRNGNEYLESMIAGYRARTVPVNVNYRYVDEELHHLLSDTQVRALVYHAEFAPQVAELRARLPQLEVLIQVADDSGNDLLPGAVDYEEAVRTPPGTAMPVPAGDDLYIICTGGTTGLPKAVLWHQDDIFVRAMGGTPFGSDQPFDSYEQIAEAARDGGDGMRLLMTAPFMHGAAQWSTFHVVTTGGRLVLPADNTRLDWEDALAATAREGVISIPIIGDAMARPMLAALEGGRFDLSGLAAINNGGAPLSPAVRTRLLEALPHVLLLDAVGSSETGIQMNHTSAAAAEADTAVFTPDATTTVVADDLARELPPGGGQGWLATKGRVPQGYLGDEGKTARTFPVIGGRRYSVPGDRAIACADGRIELLGREGLTINSGGEKIFVEEVERAVAAHPEVRDVVVVGRPSERWGDEVVALVELDPADATSDAELLAECAKHIARYKLPKTILRCTGIVRSPAGKADYSWARSYACSARPDAEPEALRP